MLGLDPPARMEPMVIKFDEEKFPKIYNHGNMGQNRNSFYKKLYLE